VNSHNSRRTLLPPQAPSFEPHQIRQHAAQDSSQEDSGEAQLPGASQRSAGKQKQKGRNRKAELAREHCNKQYWIGRVYEVVAHLNLTLPARSHLTLLHRQMQNYRRL
jgi:hypothetical protein